MGTKQHHQRNRLVGNHMHLDATPCDSRRRATTYSLSKDFAASAGTEVKSDKAPLVRAVVILHALARKKPADDRTVTLADAWKKETDKQGQVAQRIPAKPARLGN